MAIKYVHVPEKKKTIAILAGTELDAVKKIEKMCSDSNMFFNAYDYIMPHEFRAVVVCSAEDEYSEAVGEKFAKAKVMDKYYKAFDRKVDKFRENLIKLNSRAFDSNSVNI